MDNNDRHEHIRSAIGTLESLIEKHEKSGRRIAVALIAFISILFISGLSVYTYQIRIGGVVSKSITSAMRELQNEIDNKLMDKKI